MKCVAEIRRNKTWRTTETEKLLRRGQEQVPTPGNKAQTPGSLTEEWEIKWQRSGSSRGRREGAFTVHNSIRDSKTNEKETAE